MMEISIINIGNSKGIRIPKKILEQYKITDGLELLLAQDHMILKPKTEIRKGWAEAFEQMHLNGDDQLLIDDVFDDENFEVWNP